MQPAAAAAAAPVAGTAVALPRPVQVPYTQVMQAADLSASLTNVSSLTSLQPTASHATPLPIANAAASSINILGTVPSTSFSVSSLTDGASVSDSVIQISASSATTSSTSWLVTCMKGIMSYLLKNDIQYPIKFQKHLFKILILIFP